MKQSEIIIGNEYLFKTTHTEHKKDMINTVVKVVGSVKGRLKKRTRFGGNMSCGTNIKTPTKYKLSNGRYANAAELKEITA